MESLLQSREMQVRLEGIVVLPGADLEHFQLGKGPERSHKGGWSESLVCGSVIWPQTRSVCARDDMLPLSTVSGRL